MPVLEYPEVLVAIHGFIALVFVTAAYAKMRHWQTFEGVVANYRLLPDALVKPMTYGLPPAEMLIGAALAFGSAGAEIAAAALLAIFAGAMAVNLWRGRSHIDCGCFDGTLKQTLRWSLVVRNAGLIALLGVAAAMHGGIVHAWQIVTGILAGGAGFIVLQSLNALWSIVPAPRRAQAHS